jgi:L-threonylcarbamoyladenylate synthase
MTDFTPDIEACLQVLHTGGIILYPTDTVWGLGCDATNANAVEKIFTLKQRPANKSVIVLMADERDVLKYVAGLNLAVFDYLATVSKPTTVVYESAIGLAENVINANGSVAVRIVKDDFCRHLIKRFRKPIVSTSANISDKPTPRIFKEIATAVITGADYVVNYRSNDETCSQPSAVVKWNNGNIEILRP